MPTNVDDVIKKLSPGQRKSRDAGSYALRGYVEAMGGKLSLVAEFPNQTPGHSVRTGRNR